MITVNMIEEGIYAHIDINIDPIELASHLLILII